jgi:hypothetical protein
MNTWATAAILACVALQSSAGGRDEQRTVREEVGAAYEKWGKARESPRSRLTRFDAEILTVQKTEDGWSVVITEKLESERVTDDGKTERVCGLWVTRDGWRETDEGWVATFSEVIGNEGWAPGQRPPFKSW